MAAPSPKHVDSKPARPRRKTSVRLANAHDQAAPSPALHRQAMVQDQWLEAYEAANPRWPIRRTIAVVTLSCGGFWAGVIWGLSKLAQ